MAQALVAARVPKRRIMRSLKELRRRLPESLPLSGLSIGAVGDRVVVREGRDRWQAESGQYLLAFEVAPENRGQTPVSAGRIAGAPDGNRGLSPVSDLDAHIEGALRLHEAGRLAEAEGAYRAALAACGPDPVLNYNFAALLEDLGRKPEAAAAYEAALRADPAMADGHYNLALVYEQLGRRREAIRHMSHYRRLVKGAK